MSPLETFKNQHPVSQIRLIAGILTVAAVAWLGHALSHTLSCFLLSFVIA